MRATSVLNLRRGIFAIGISVDAVAKEIKALSEAISRAAPSTMGYSVRSLCEIDGDKTYNIFTILRFSVDDGRGASAEIVSGTRLQVLRMWVNLDKGNQVIADASDKRHFTLGSREIDFFPDVRPYLWQENTDVWLRDNFSGYGMDRPGRIALYTNGGPLPTVDKRSLLATGYDTLSDFIRFRLVSDTGAIKGYYPTFQNPGMFVVIPHWHASIGSIEIVDTRAKVTVKSDFGDSLFDNLRLSCKVYTQGGETVSRIFKPLGHDGVIAISDLDDNISRIEVNLYFEPVTGEVFWVDRAMEDGKSSATNARMAAHSLFFQDDGFLEKRLSGEEGTTTEFEWAVCTTFHLAGYQVDWWGLRKGVKGQKKKGVHEIDLLAFNEPFKKVLAIECTTKDGELQDKIQSLSSRCTVLEEKLKPLAWSVLPIVCTTMSKAQIEAWKQNSGQQPRLRIFGGDELKNILEKVKAGTPFNLVAMAIEMPVEL